MAINIGAIDRGLRIVAGAILIALALGLIPGTAPFFWGWLGVIPLATALTGYCPVYSILGLSTCSKRT